jgi:hypothetical protein
MIGGVVAAILGPLLTIIARDVPGLPRFAGVYLVVARWVFCLRLIWPCSSVDQKNIPCSGHRGAPGTVTDQSGVNETSGLSYGLVSPGRWLLGDAFSHDGGPLSVTHHHSMNDGALVIQLHLLGMYVPSLFTGLLIRKVGITVCYIPGSRSTYQPSWLT